MPLELAIVTPGATVVETTADSIVAPAAEGEIGVLPGHENFLCALNPGVVVYQAASGGSTRVAVAGGFAEVAGDRVTILARDAAVADSIDRDAIATTLSEAQSALAATTPSSPPEEVTAAQEAIAVAEAWLAAKDG